VDPDSPDVGHTRAATVPVLQMGDTAVHVVSDGGLPYPTDFVSPDVPSDELDAALAGRLDEQGHLWLPYHCLLITTPSQTVLVDSGLGRTTAAAWGVPAGRMLDSLALAGFAPSDIDTVVITHAHPDHIGGLTDGGALVLAGARHVIEAREWACWTDEDQLRRMPDLLTGARGRCCRCWPRRMWWTSSGARPSSPRASSSFPHPGTPSGTAS
jgi:glyoxylase-like metal-dependent hydrolase (beta-lactamase superfamily II)